MILKKLGVFAAAVSVLLATTSIADTLEVKENHPTKYVVQKGDTLWDISAKFLKKPWYWPKIWHVNPQVDDPHWIYPGDVLTLVWIDGQPYLKRAEPVQIKDAPIKTISGEAVKSFLKKDAVLPYDGLDKLPYVLGDNDSRTLMANTTDLYVKGTLTKGQQYGIYEKGELLKDEEGNKLGYYARLVAVTVAGNVYENNVNKTYLVKNISAVKQGQYLMPFSGDEGYNLYFVPKAATVDAKVIALGDKSRFAGKNDTVILSKGSSNGVQVGDVFQVARVGEGIAGGSADSVEYSNMATVGKNLLHENLPDDVVGEVMVYRTYDKVSLGLIMNSYKDVRVGYKAKKPE